MTMGSIWHLMLALCKTIFEPQARRSSTTVNEKITSSLKRVGYAPASKMRKVGYNFVIQDAVHLVSISLQTSTTPQPMRRSEAHHSRPTKRSSQRYQAATYYARGALGSTRHCSGLEDGTIIAGISSFMPFKMRDKCKQLHDLRSSTHR
jgi:hypothetical protein